MMMNNKFIVTAALCMVGTVNAYSQGNVDRVDVQIVKAYQTALSTPVPGEYKSRRRFLSESLSRMESQDRLLDGQIPTYLALRAISTELGNAVTKVEFADLLKKKFSKQTRKIWFPAARRIWLLGLLQHSTHQSEEYRPEIEELAKNSEDVSALEAHLLGAGALTRETGYKFIDQLITYSDKHPGNIVAPVRAATLLYSMSLHPKDRGSHPLRFDLIERVYKLESRTTRNMSNLMNENVKSIKVFRLLRERVDGTEQ